MINPKPQITTVAQLKNMRSAQKTVSLALLKRIKSKIKSTSNVNSLLNGKSVKMFPGETKPSAKPNVFSVKKQLKGDKINLYIHTPNPVYTKGQKLAKGKFAYSLKGTRPIAYIDLK